MVQLKVTITIGNAYLDGPQVMRSVPQAFEAVATSIYANVGKGGMTIAPAGVAEPVQVAFEAEWQAPSRLNDLETREQEPEAVGAAEEA